MNFSASPDPIFLIKVSNWHLASCPDAIVFRSLCQNLFEYDIEKIGLAAAAKTDNLDDEFLRFP